MRLSRLAFPALALLLAASPVGAEEKHHPPAGDSGKAAEAQAPAPTRPGMGMMGQGMMGAGMMSGAGPATHLLAPARIEGRVAYLRAELAVTAAQEAGFNALAAALRASENQDHAAKPGHGGKMRMGMMSSAAPAAGALAERLAHEEHVAAARLETLKSVRVAYETLDKLLTVEQRKAAETLLPLLFPGLT